MSTSNETYDEVVFRLEKLLHMVESLDSDDCVLFIVFEKHFDVSKLSLAKGAYN